MPGYQQCAGSRVINSVQGAGIPTMVQGAGIPTMVQGGVYTHGAGRRIYRHGAGREATMVGRVVGRGGYPGIYHPTIPWVYPWWPYYPVYIPYCTPLGIPWCLLYTPYMLYVVHWDLAAKRRGPGLILGNN